MCAPPAVALIAAGVAAAGSMASGLSQAGQLRQQANIAQRNAQEANQRAIDAIQRGQMERVQLDRRYSQIQGQQQAAMAANGIDLGFGSALAVSRDTQMLRNEDAATLYRNQSNALHGIDIEVSNYRAEAAAKRQAATGAIVSAGFGAASSILGGASQFSRMKGTGAYGVTGSGGIY